MHLGVAHLPGDLLEEEKRPVEHLKIDLGGVFHFFFFL